MDQLGQLTTSLNLGPTAPEALTVSTEGIGELVTSTAGQMVQAGELLPTQHPSFIPELRRLEGNINAETIVQRLQDASVGWEERSDPQAFAARLTSEAVERGVPSDHPQIHQAISGYQANTAVELRASQEEAIIGNIQRGVDYRAQAAEFGYTDEDYAFLERQAEIDTAEAFGDIDILPEDVTAEEFRAVDDRRIQLQQEQDAGFFRDLDDATNEALNVWLSGDNAIIDELGPVTREEFRNRTFNIDQINDEQIFGDMRAAWNNASQGNFTQRDVGRVIRGVWNRDVPVNFLEDLTTSFPVEIIENSIPPQSIQDAAEVLQEVRQTVDLIQGGPTALLTDGQLALYDQAPLLITEGIAQGMDPRLLTQQVNKMITDGHAEAVFAQQEEDARFARFMELRAKAKGPR